MRHSTYPSAFSCASASAASTILFDFKFKDATAPPKPDVPNSGGPVNYDAEFMNIPENIMIMRNINPFRRGDEFDSQAEKDAYFDFVKIARQRSVLAFSKSITSVIDLVCWDAEVPVQS